MRFQCIRVVTLCLCTKGIAETGCNGLTESGISGLLQAPRREEDEISLREPDRMKNNSSAACRPAYLRYLTVPNTN